MIELDAEPHPHFATFDGSVIELWHHMPDKDSVRWHVRHVKDARLETDKKGRHRVLIELDISGNRGFGVSDENLPRAEELVEAIRAEVQRRRSH